MQVLVGKKTPTALYAYGMWLGPPQKQGHAGCHPLSPLAALNPPAAVVKSGSVKEVGRGLRASGRIGLGHGVRASGQIGLGQGDEWVGG